MKEKQTVTCPLCGHKEEIPAGANPLFIKTNVKRAGCQACRFKKSLIWLKNHNDHKTAMIALAFMGVNPEVAPAADTWKSEAEKFKEVANHTNPWAHHFFKRAAVSAR